MLKSLIGNPVVQFLIGRTIGLCMLLVGWTTRWRLVNRAAVEPFWADPKARLVCCIWHGRFSLVHKLWAFGPGLPKAKFLISRSREGGIVAHVSQTVGADVIRGSAAKRSQQKGGVEATFEMIRHIDGGGVIGMTPDGPRGPRMRAKMGPVQIAKMAQAPLMPLAWSTNNRRVLKSWDRMIIPFPFGRGVLIWGDPIPAPSPNADAAEMERVRARLEQELNRLSAEADRLAGVQVIEPEPATGAVPDEAEAAQAAAAS
jgi:hypothetical protein